MTVIARPRAAGREVSFDLHTLGWRDFQDLCVTVVAEVWGQSVQTYFSTRDGGRDGAFSGIFKPKRGQSMKGNFVVQCKFSAKADRQLNLSDLDDELAKAAKLARRGLCHNYVLMTNCRLTGQADANIRAAFEKVRGITRCLIYGAESITRFIRENQRLRMLVPRVYGLGDLSQILDARAYRQAQEILVALRDELSKFVITDAFRKSVKALNKHGFVLLLGEPASGKSMIASALSLAAADKWGCQVVKVRDAAHFDERWNPDEPKQFFWVDDALGQTQYDRDRALSWNHEFQHLDAAIKGGARVVFTSRDYIYREALDDLKESAFPLLRESQVVIRVEQLSVREKEQILYNHLRLGSQPQFFRTAMKPFLEEVATHPRFLPEIARRLGNPLFTQHLSASRSDLLDFVEHPQKWLEDVIRTVDEASRAALALVFMNGGKLRSPIRLTPEEDNALKVLNASAGKVRKALKAQQGTLVTLASEKGEYSWAFKHPTIRDAYAALVAEERELLDIYIAGAPQESLLEEATCGYFRYRGTKVRVPEDRYQAVLNRLDELPTNEWRYRRALLIFLAERCSKNFLKLYLTRHTGFLRSLQVHSWLSYVADVRLIARLHEVKLLPEWKRKEFVEIASRLAVETPDADFLGDNKLRRLFKGRELLSVLDRVQTELVPNLRRVIDEWSENFDADSADPDDHFWTLTDALQSYQQTFSGNEALSRRISRALSQIEKRVRELRKRDETRSKDEIATQKAVARPEVQRSVFDDVDE